MKFKKEVTFVLEGEMYDESFSVEKLVQSLNWSWTHWWEKNPNWPYGNPSNLNKSAILHKVYFEGKELKNKS